MDQCLAAVWRLLRLTVERERGVRTSGAYHWLLLSEGGGGLKERGEDEERGWERGCVRKEEGKQGGQMIMSLCACAGACFFHL